MLLELCVLRRRQHHALALFRLGCGRLVEIKDARVLIATVLVAHLGTGSYRREHLDRAHVLLEVLLDRHVAH